MTRPASRSIIPAPLRRSSFRRLWLGMSTSYAGDRLQQLAQGWLVATLTGSALGVGLIGVLGSLPLLLLPLGGVVADQVDRRRILLITQAVGAVSTIGVAGLVLADQLAIWHIYVWAAINGLGTLVARPAYKVVLTEAVPADEIRSAVAINSMTETGSMVLVNALGSMLIGVVGLPVAFMLNVASYLVAVAGLASVPGVGRLPDGRRSSLTLAGVAADLREGVAYLRSRPALLQPILLTFVTIVAIAPAISLLAAIVHDRGGSITDLGLLGAGMSAGSFAGAAFAGARRAGAHSARRYAVLGLLASTALALFVVWPVTPLQLVSLAVIGFVAFAEAVWNTSRIREIADSAFQARLQAITSMAFTLGFTVAALWAGIAVDRLGTRALLAGAIGLGLCSAMVLVRRESQRDVLDERLGEIQA